MQSAWLEHGPFAFWLINATRPAVLVELGAHNGFSYLSFCQVIQRLGLATSCYAVDTWSGDEHAGFYGADVYERLVALNGEWYPGFSSLLRCKFDEALPYFSDGSIDILHIDGRHTYEDVRHDFESWKQKLSLRAIVLFHDINVRERDFGVWRLWAELKGQYPSFEFMHGYGLGVLAVGAEIPAGIAPLFSSSPSQRRTIRIAYARLGRAVTQQYQFDLVKRDFDTAVATQARLEAQCHAFEVEAAKLRAECQALEEVNVRLDVQCQASEDEADKLQAELAAAANATQEARARALRLEQSTFWRASAPLRVALNHTPRPIRRLLRRGVKALWWALTPQRLPARLAALRERKRLLPACGGVSYSQWIENNEHLSGRDLTKIARKIESIKDNIKLSIIMPVYDTRPSVLSEAIDSVRAQAYPNWELCIADDASPSAALWPILKQAAATDSRIKILRREENGGICAASNSALELATGDFIVLMDHDDLLSPLALYEVAAELDEHPAADLIYSDEDRIDNDGNRTNPYFKPDWDPDLLLSQNYISHLGVYRRSIVAEIGGFRIGFEGSQDWDFVLRFSERIPADHIRHIPAILYHWRRGGESGSFSETQLEKCSTAGRKAVAEHLERSGIVGASVNLRSGCGWVETHWPLPSPLPKVSIIIPTKNRYALLKSCIESIINNNEQYENKEIIIIDNNSSEYRTIKYLSWLSNNNIAKILKIGGHFNFSKLNNTAVKQATGEILLFLNNDTEVIRGDWLHAMAAQAVRPEIGAVGARLLYGSGRVQHAGVIMGVGGSPSGEGGVAVHAFRNWGREEPGYFGYLQIAHCLSAVTAACLATRREVFDEVGGFDEKDLAVAFNDIDLCMKIRQHGYRIIWEPRAELFHHESVSRGPDTTPEKIARFRRETETMLQRWHDSLLNDPYYNQNLHLSNADYEFGLISRRVPPWRRASGSD